MYHSLTIVGNLGRDPEMRFTSDGKAIASFSVATSNQYTNKQGEKVKETTWFRISTFGKQAEICKEYLAKGSKVLVVGRLNADPSTGAPRIWQKADGTNGTSFEVTAETVRFLDKAKSGEKQDDTPDMNF